MNKILMIIMLMMIFGLTASNVSAECAIHAKSLNTEYNELSPAEFFYGVPMDSSADTNVTTGNVFAVTPDDTRATDLLSNSEFFYGYSIPDRMEAISHVCNRIVWDRTPEQTSISAVSDPSLFFGYVDAGACSNC
jgi:hypothetical protein